MAISFAFTALILGAAYVNAQSSNVTTCSVAAYNQLNNKLGQNPCLIAAYARGECVGGPFTMNSIAPQTHYIPNDPNPCECSAVVYNLASACGLCQGRIIINFNIWVTGCSGSNGPFSGYPEAIPPGTAFPSWAYLSPLQTNNFSLSAALAVIGYPESSPVPQTLVSATGGGASATSASTTSRAVTTVESLGGGEGGSSAAAPAFSFSNPSNTGSPSDNGGGGSTSNAGAIAGGVVGGLVGLAIIAGLITWLLIKKRRKQANTIPPSEYAAGGAYGANPVSSPVNAGVNPSVYSNENQGAPNMGQYSQGNNAALKPYNPSDPSTYPVSPSTPTIQTTQHAGYGGAQDGYGGRPPAPGQYSGVAEL